MDGFSRLVVKLESNVLLDILDFIPKHADAVDERILSLLEVEKGEGCGG